MRLKCHKQLHIKHLHKESFTGSLQKIKLFQI